MIYEIKDLTKITTYNTLAKELNETNEAFYEYVSDYILLKIVNPQISHNLFRYERFVRFLKRKYFSNCNNTELICTIGRCVSTIEICKHQYNYIYNEYSINNIINELLQDNNKKKIILKIYNNHNITLIELINNLDIILENESEKHTLIMEHLNTLIDLGMIINYNKNLSASSVLSASPILVRYIQNNKVKEWLSTANYLYDKFKGQYRIRAPINQLTNDFNRKLNGTLEDIDCYIDCQFGNKVFYYGHNILQAYIPSLGRGHNILKNLEETDKSLVFDIEETDSEILFKFKYVNSDKIIPLLKPKTSGSQTSPFSPKNLPKSDFKIPDDKLEAYKQIASKIPPEKLLILSRITHSYLQTLITKKNTWENIKSDMRLKCVKGKEYICMIGKWEEYLRYLENEIKKMEWNVYERVHS